MLEQEVSQLRLSSIEKQSRINYLQAALDGHLIEDCDPYQVHADFNTGSWINYQMKLNGVTQKHVAAMAGVSRQMVQRVAYGVSTSAKVQRTIAQSLGYKSWSELVAARQGVAA
jgi:hypothetical protein